MFRGVIVFALSVLSLVGLTSYADEAADVEAADVEAAAQDSPKSHITTRIYKLAHANASEVAEKFNEMWNGEFGQKFKVTRMAVAFEESNTLMLTAPQVILEACESTLETIDVEAAQVYIEARFVELGNAASHKIGIDWSLLDGMTGTVGLGGGIQQFTLGDGVESYKRQIVSKGDTTEFSLRAQQTQFDEAGNRLVSSGGNDGSINYFKGTLDFSQMSLTLKALDATNDARTFSNPKIIVSSGKKATVDMTTKYPNVKVSAKRTESSGSTSLDLASSMEAIPGEDKFMFAKEAFFSWGISLHVTPRIGTNGLINVTIVPTISQQQDWVTTGTSSDDGSGTVAAKYPVIKVQRLVTEFNLESGTTAVIGGLSVTEEAQRDTGIPLLREIPWIGPRLFGSLERYKEQKEIIVFVTVGLVNPRSVAMDAGLPKNAILGRQYVRGQKLEPADMPEKNMEGLDSLDLRPLDEQAKDPLRQQKTTLDFEQFIPFRKDPNYKHDKEIKE